MQSQYMCSDNARENVDFERDSKQEERGWSSSMLPQVLSSRMAALNIILLTYSLSARHAQW